MLQGYLNTWMDKITEEEDELRYLSNALTQLELPFGFMKGFQMEQKIVKQVKTIIQGPNFEERETGLSQELSLPHDIALKLEKAENDAKVLVG